MIKFFCILRSVFSPEQTMIQIKDLLDALCSGVKSPVERQSLLFRIAPDIGFLHSFSLPDYIEVIQSGEFYQTNLLMVSAGSDFTVSTCDLMLLSAINESVKVGYAVAQKGNASGKCWGK